MEVSSEPLMYMRHIRQAKFCARGVKEWFPLHGIDINRLKAGIPVSEIEATGCQLGITAASFAREDHNGRR